MSETLARGTYNVAFLSIKEDLAHDESIIADFHESADVFFQPIAPITVSETSALILALVRIFTGYSGSNNCIGNSRQASVDYTHLWYAKHSIPLSLATLISFSMSFSPTLVSWVQGHEQQN